MLRKILVLAITLLQVVVFGSLIVWRVMDWNSIGWTGMSYNIDTEVEGDGRLPAFFLGAESRQIELLVPGGPADRAGIEVDDQVVSVNGLAVADLDGLQGLARSSRTGDTLIYQLDHADWLREVDVQLEAPYRNPLVVFGTATSVAAGAVFLLISMLVYWSRPRSQVALVFFLMCLFGAAEYLVWAVIEFDFPNMRGVVPTIVEPLMFAGLMLVGFFAVALVNTLLHLALVFPRTRPIVRNWPQVLVWVHILPFLLILVVLSTMASGFSGRTVTGTAIVGVVLALGGSALILRLRRLAVNDIGPGRFRSHPWIAVGLIVLIGGIFGLVIRFFDPMVRGWVLGAVFVVAFFACMVAILVYSVLTVVALYRSYQESGIDEQRQVRWPLWGTATAVGSSVILMLISLALSIFFGDVGRVDFTTNVVLSTASKLVYLLIPISLAFGIVKYRLMEIDLIIRKTVIYSVVTGFVLVIYLLLAGVSGLAIVRSAGLESQAATVVATLLVVALFVPVRNWIQHLVDRFFSRRERDTQASIARVTETVMQSASLEAMSLGVAEEVQKALGCRTVAILARRAGSDQLIAEATVGLPDRVAPAIALPSSSPVLKTASVHVVVDRGELSEAERDIARKTAADRAVICRRGDEPVGLITVGRKLSREPFDDEDEVFLDAVAGQYAIGVGRLRGRRAELEFTQALQIQRSLLPAEIPQIEGVEVAARWQPAREVSGDYYDVLRLDEKRLAVCIGDVVGKGMPAALLMSNLQAAVKAVATADADPAGVCTQVRSVVTSNLQGGKFVTFFFAIIDGDGRRLAYANCGHNQPVLVRRNGDSHRLSEGGPAFARLMRDLDYTTGEIALEPGDRLVLFTDGVSEAENGEGEQFGEDSIVELVVAHREKNADELEAAVSDTVLAHADGSLQDDLTMVVVAVE